MTRRKWAVLLFVGVVTASVVVVAWLAARPSDIPGFDALRPGMTQAQAEAEVGRKADTVCPFSDGRSVLFVGPGR